MNGAVLRSLMRDAYYQVLDNLGFRILAVLFLLPALILFLVGFREDGIWIAHYWRWDYQDLLPQGALGSGASSGAAVSAETIRQVREQGLQALVSLMVDSVAGRFGMLFGIAAISFFVPQMLERGAADVVFSKPASRVALLLSRYVAGLVFIGLLSTVLVGGIFLGLAVSSDYVDFGLLWSIPTMIYGFAIFHAVSCMVGVFTRNTIAAILLTIVFIFVNWVVHTVFERQSLDQRERAENIAAGDRVDDMSSFGVLFLRMFDVLHVTLPKSSDAIRIAQSMRRRFELNPPDFVDEELGMTISAAPKGYTREPRSSLYRDGLTWIAPHPDGAREATWTLKRARTEEIGSRASQVKQLRKDLNVDSVRSDISGRIADRFEWTVTEGGEKRQRRKWVFQIGDSILQLDYDAEHAWANSESEQHSSGVFVAGFQVLNENERIMASESYDHYFDWDASWRFNAALSVSTTLLFIVGVLGLGAWKLSRIDF